MWRRAGKWRWEIGDSGLGRNHQALFWSFLSQLPPGQLHGGSLQLQVFPGFSLGRCEVDPVRAIISSGTGGCWCSCIAATLSRLRNGIVIIYNNIT